jgi:glycosyltransferase involved in cell wall biosynthesis
MRVLILHSRYRSGAASGENRVVEDETRLLRSAGHEVDTFTPTIESTAPSDLLRAAVRTIWSVPAAAEVDRRIRRHRPHVVHIHNLFPALSPAILRSIPSGTAVVATLHNYRLMCLPGTFLRDQRVCEDCLGRVPWPGVLHRCYQRSAVAGGVLASSLGLHRNIGSFGRIDLFFAISEFVRMKHIEGGLPADSIVVKRHFTWPAPVRVGPGDYFLFLGRLSPEKGVSTLIDAWGDAEAKLVIVGDGPERSALQQKAPSLVEFRPTVGPQDVADLLLRSRALMVPSLSHEGAGRVILEAYASGVPVIASRVGGIPEFVEDRVTGRLVPAGDPVGWRKAVVELLDDRLNERMGVAGHRLWRRSYEPTQALAALERAYSQALVRARSRAADASTRRIGAGRRRGAE